MQAKWRLPMCWSHLVVHTVEQSRHHREDGWPQGLHVVRKEADVALIEADPSSMAVHYRLQTHTWNKKQ